MHRLMLHESHAFHGLSYLLHQPPGFDEEPRPLVLFLHGAGERGGSLKRVTEQGIPKLIERGRNVPFIALSPHCPAGGSWSELMPTLRSLLDDVAARVHADPRRIYLTGISMGGFGVWQLAAQSPERFAALVPICGGGDPSWAPKLASLPTWIFHGQADDVVPVEQSLRMVRALEAVHAPVRLTIYKGVGHDSWTCAYDDPELFQWLLGQRRSDELAESSTPPL